LPAADFYGFDNDWFHCPIIKSTKVSLLRVLKLAIIPPILNQIGAL